MTLNDFVGTVRFAGFAASGQMAHLAAQTHGAAQVGGRVAQLDLAFGIDPLGDQPHHRVLGIVGKLGGVGVFPASHVAGELDHRYLHA